MMLKSKRFLVSVLTTAILVITMSFSGFLYADPVSGEGIDTEKESALSDDTPGKNLDGAQEPDLPDASDTIQKPEAPEAVSQPETQADQAPAGGVVISGLIITPVTNGQIKVQYSITNNTAAVLSRSNVVAYYKNEISKSNYLFNRSLQYDVQPGDTVTMTDTVSYTRIANLALVLRLFDNGTTYPYVKPTAFPIGDTSGNVAYRPFDPGKTVSLTGFSVSHISKNKVILTYTITNNTDKPVSKSSYYALYKNSVESKNYLIRHNLKQDVPAGASVTMIDTVSSNDVNIGTYQLAMRLFDTGTTSYPFPYMAPNLFYDGRLDNKTAYEAIGSSLSTVALSDFSVKKVSTDKVTFTYTIKNTSNGSVSRNSKVAFYENSSERANLLFTLSLGKDIEQGGSAVITTTATYTNISSKRIVARLFDNGTTFPYLSPNTLTDNNLENKTVEAASFKTKIVCVGDSITYGYGVDKQYNYTAQLQRKLGDDYAIVNYGVSGRTASSKGDDPYVKHSYYQSALKSEPDIVIIMLGSNDARKENQTSARLGVFESEYKNLVMSFVNLPNKPKVYVVAPIGVIKLTNINISEELLRTQIRPAIRRVAVELDVELIDFETLLASNSGYYLSDGKHPSRVGYDVMSSAFYDVLIN